MKEVRNRIEIAHLYGGGILITTLILVAGRATPRVLKGVARLLEHFLRRIDA